MRVAVIGVGNMGKHHARVYSRLKNAKLVAVSDIDEKKRKIAKRFGCKFYKNYRQMLEKENIDAVSVAVPTKFHKEVALECIKRGKNILVEKPISDTVEDAKQIVAAARKKRVKLTVGHTERFNPAVQKLREMIKRGELGRVTTIVARRVGVFPPQIKDASVIIDIGVHDIDVLNYLLGKKPKKIFARSGKALSRNRDDYADILLKYDGANAFIQVNWITPVKIRNLAVTGTKGYAELNYITQELVFYRSNYRVIDDFSDVIKFGTPEIVKIKVEKSEPLKLELDSFIDCVSKNKRPVVSGEDGLNALETALKAIRACKL